ncbi:MAG: helix-turn-helix domain-containing protein [Actinobacteria bacterium]|nr:helix-turn-helix domain-containing protein [Actinomycetota bacterium]
MLPAERDALGESLRTSAPQCVDRAVVRARRVARLPSPTYASDEARVIEDVYEHLIEMLEVGWRPAAEVPLAVLGQARLAAAADVRIDVYIRRWVAVTSHISLHVTIAVSQLALSKDARVEVARTQARVFDRLVESAVEEFVRAEGSRGTNAGARLELVRGLLAGEAVDPAALGYEFDRHHLALIAEGLEDRRLKELAAALSANILLVSPGTSVRWAWMATVDELETDAIRSAVQKALPSECKVGFGRSESGEDGWRASHSQAASALSVALRTGGAAYYEDVMLVASVSSDRVPESFLRRHYLNPINDPPRGSATLLETLRAYLGADRNGSSAAAALKVSRQTVGTRLQAAEHRLGRTLNSCWLELEIALRLDELDRMVPHRQPN